MKLQVWTTLFEWKKELKVWAFSLKWCSKSHPDEYSIAELPKFSQSPFLEMDSYVIWVLKIQLVYLYFIIITILLLQDLTFKCFLEVYLA